MDFDPWEEYDVPVGDSSEEESGNSDGSSEEKECSIPGYWFSTEERNWLELPPEVMSLIFIKVGVIDILLVLQSVCSAWRMLSKEPQLFRSINMYNRWDLFLDEEHDMMKIAREAVNRNCGQLVEFSVEKFATDELLDYITEKNSPLRRLRFASCYDISDEGLTDMAEKLPLLEELEFCFCSISEEVFEIFGRSCPLLKSFRLNNQGYKGPPSMESDEAALAIGHSMLGLRHLNLFGNLLTDNGLQAILDGCPHLSYLDLRQCFNLTFAGGLLKNCVDRRNIKRKYDTELDDSSEEEEDSEEDSEMFDSEDEDSEMYDSEEEDSDDSLEEREVRPKKVRKLKEKGSKEVRNWLELPPDVMSQIFLKLDTIDILFRVQSVCSAWRNLAKEPQLYRSIDMQLQWQFFDRGELVWEKMAKVAVDRSCGQCVDFAAEDFPTDELMLHIADKRPPLRRLRLVSCYDIGEEALIETAKNLPLLEEVEIIFGSLSEAGIEAFGHSCPLLKYFRLNDKGDNDPDRVGYDEEALSIAQSMPGLHHLPLFRNSLTDIGLLAILDGCPHLESLDLRQCFSLKFGGNLKKRCADRNIELKLLNDSTIGYEFDAKCIGDADSESDSPPDSYFWFNYNNSDW